MRASRPRTVHDTEESRRESYILYDEEEEQRRQAKRKTEMAFKERDIRWQHREETWQQIRSRRILQRQKLGGGSIDNSLEHVNWPWMRQR
ncbi:unnamed protein product [Rhizophagus irregularis]|nr:unnamed protein product [Rhizophagus irregularis]CAB5383686.1 unnamed protein product [Rhizophagus irregularis]